MTQLLEKSLKDAGIIKDGYNSEVDELRNIAKKGKDFLSELEQKERQKTGISSLKVGYNKIYGFYIEVTKPNLYMVPENYIRKQTLVGSERFVTSELKEYESKILGAEERLKNLEYELFKQLLDILHKECVFLSQTASAIAIVDFITALAIVAKRHRYIKPYIDDSGVLDIIDGRHILYLKGYHRLKDSYLIALL